MVAMPSRDEKWAPSFAKKTAAERWGIRGDLALASLDALRHNAPPVMRKQIIPAFMAILAAPPSSRGLSLYGHGRMGKTYLLAALFNAARDAGISVGWLGTRGKCRGYVEEVVEHCSAVDIFALPHIDFKGGPEHRSFNSICSRIVKNRKNAGLPTFTTSGSDPREYEKLLCSGQKRDDEQGNRAALFSLIAEENEFIEIPFSEKEAVRR